MMKYAAYCLALCLSACVTSQPLPFNELYFDANGEVVDAPVKGGYIRRILHTHARDYTVQDFYGMGGNKRTDPMRLRREQLHQWHARPAHTVIRSYDRHGNPFIASPNK